MQLLRCVLTEPRTGTSRRLVFGLLALNLTPCYMFLQELMEYCKQIEDSLVSKCWEKAQLDSELAKLPAGSGRNLNERRRKADVERRLDFLNKEISSMKVELKKLMGK